MLPPVALPTVVSLPSDGALPNGTASPARGRRVRVERRARLNQGSDMAHTSDHRGEWQSDAWSGGRVAPAAVCLLAPNPGPLTLDGTNTWVLGRRAASSVLVVDPGPDDESHLRAVADAVRANG